MITERPMVSYVQFRTFRYICYLYTLISLVISLQPALHSVHCKI